MFHGDATWTMAAGCPSMPRRKNLHPWVQKLRPGTETAWKTSSATGDHQKKRVDMVYQTKNAEHQPGRFLLGGKPTKAQRLSVLFGQCSDPFWLHHLYLGGIKMGLCGAVRWSWEDGEHKKTKLETEIIQKSSRNSMDCFNGKKSQNSRAPSGKHMVIW